jgi:hypothetical protein
MKRGHAMLAAGLLFFIGMLGWSFDSGGREALDGPREDGPAASPGTRAPTLSASRGSPPKPPITVELDPARPGVPAELEGLCVDEYDHGVSLADVVAYQQEAGHEVSGVPRVVARSTSDAAGRWAMTLPQGVGGRFSLRALKPGLAGAQVPIRVLAAQLRTGIRLPLYRAGVLRVRVVGSERGDHRRDRGRRVACWGALRIGLLQRTTDGSRRCRRLCPGVLRASGRIGRRAPPLRGAGGPNRDRPPGS